MTVYVDVLRTYPNSLRNFYLNEDGEWCNLCADSLEELNAFAKELGLGRERLSETIMPHYHLTPPKRRAAIQRGAVEITGRQMVQLAFKLRRVAQR